MHTAVNYFELNTLICNIFSRRNGEITSLINELSTLRRRIAAMELKRINDSAQRNQAKPGQYKIQNFDTRISQETAEALKQVEANMQLAEQKAGRLLVA